MLVDYADSELAADEEELVREHLAHCLACRQDLARLDRSLQISRTIWDQCLDQCPPSADAATLNQSRRQWRASLRRAAVVLAASLLLTAGFWATPKPIDRMAQEVKSRGGNESTQPVDSAAVQINSVAQMDVALIEQRIARATMAARLEASSRLLSTDPSLSEYRERNDRLLATQFADLEAGKQALRRLNGNN